MQTPLEIHFHGVPPSDAIERRIHSKAGKLDRFFDKITRCRVVVERPHHRRTQGDLFVVRVDVHIPGEDAIVSKCEHDDHGHEDAFVAIRDAFDSVRRQVQSKANRRRGFVKTHAGDETAWPRYST